MQQERQYPRYICHGGVELSVPDSNRRIWGHLGDISRGGFYMEGPEPWPTGTEVVARLEAGEGGEIYATAKIVTSHPGVGMGLALTKVYPQFERDFDRLILTLAAKNAEPSSALI
jgi:hypothetical protein